jgi:hypothetical protein
MATPSDTPLVHPNSFPLLVSWPKVGPHHSKPAQMARGPSSSLTIFQLFPMATNTIADVRKEPPLRDIRDTEAFLAGRQKSSMVSKMAVLGENLCGHYTNWAQNFTLYAFRMETPLPVTLCLATCRTATDYRVYAYYESVFLEVSFHFRIETNQTIVKWWQEDWKKVSLAAGRHENLGSSRERGN